MPPVVLYFLMTCAISLFMFRFNGWLHWQYVISSYSAATALWFWRRRSESGTQTVTLPDYLFSKRIWLHRSSLNDGVMALIIYAMLVPLNINGNAYHAILMTTHQLFPAVAVFGAGARPGLSIMIIYTVANIAVVDLFFYFGHRLTHTVPVLWEFHKIHHSAEVLTPLTAYRLHPIDQMFTCVMRQIGALLVTIVFLHFYPGARSLALMVGINLALHLPTSLFGNLRHSHIWLSFGQAIEHVLISPAQHQIHHSAHVKHFNHNYGAIFALWDWLFGSLYVPKAKEIVTFGLGAPALQAPYHSLNGLFCYPFQAVFKLATTRRTQVFTS